MTAIAVSSSRSLLTCGAVAGPLWAGLSLAQALFRPGFELTEQPLSLLSSGSLGWLQILNFIVAGVLTMLGAAGLSRVLPSRWAPRLVFASGVGLIAAGVFVMDSGPELTWSGYGHMIAGTVSFGTLIAACYVLGRYFNRAGNRAFAVASYVSGTALLVGDLWAMGGGTAGSLTIAIGAIAATLWVSYVSASFR
ncbi:MAG: DUF998 domain-containing protein [Kibdelosporangium sp.]